MAFRLASQIPGTIPEIENIPMSTTLPDQVSDIREDALARIQSATTVADLDTVRREVLGKSGTLPGLRRGVGALPADERRTVGAAIHEAQQAVTAAIEAREQELLDTERPCRGRSTSPFRASRLALAGCTRRSS